MGRRSVFMTGTYHKAASVRFESHCRAEIMLWLAVAIFAIADRSLLNHSTGSCDRKLSYT